MSWHMRVFTFTLCAMLSALGIGAGALAAEPQKPLIINIDNPNFRKLVVALPEFLTADSADPEVKRLAKEGAEELARLLSFSGLFNVMDPAGYHGLLKGLKSEKAAALPGLEGINLPQWKAIGVESLTVGELSKTPEGFVLEIRTADINQARRILGRSFKKIQATEFKRVISRYADLLLEAYTGKPGIFSTKIVFAGRDRKGVPKQIYVCDFDGSNLQQITHEKAAHLSPAWSPDGRYITYTSYEDGNPDLFIYEYATGKKRKLSGRKGINSGSNWSPNGKLVAFTGSNEGDADIYTIFPDGSNTKPLIRGSGLDVDPTFSPDGKWMAFVSGRYGNPHIFRAELKWDGETTVRVLNDKRLTYAGWYNATPAWSPESDKLVFAGYDKDINRFDLFIMNPDGTALERLTIRSGDNERPSWSRNGQMVIFQSSRNEGRDVKGPSQLYVMNRDGSGQRMLKTGLYDAQTPNWGPPTVQ